MLQLRDARGLVCVMAAPRYVWNKYNPKKNGPRILMARVFSFYILPGIIISFAVTINFVSLYLFYGLALYPFCLSLNLIMESVS